MIEERIIKKRITHDQEKSYLNIEFALEDVESVAIHYAYEKQRLDHSGQLLSNHSTIDFSISAPNNQYLGSAGSNRSDFYFSETASSVGFQNPDTMKGTWTIIAGAYHVPLEGLEVTYTLTIKKKQYQLVKGDTHMHTTSSDGQYSARSLIHQAEEMGLDFMIMTDHNNFMPKVNESDSSEVTVIPGVEWTQYRGHAGFLGEYQPFTGSFVTRDLASTQAKMQAVQNTGALVVLNHPFCPHCPWEWGFDVPFTGVEIWNGGLTEAANYQALTWWHQQLVAGEKLPMFGGSDFHRHTGQQTLALPVTFVATQSKSKTDILQALKNGASYLSRRLNGPEIELNAGAVTFGQTLSSGDPITISFQQLSGQEEIKVITDTDEKSYYTQANQVAYTLEFVGKEQRFVRIEIWQEKQLSVVTNAVYFF
ncbi:MAG: CehA/McbA family metallohydrolase [Enterococcus sp.]